MLQIWAFVLWGGLYEKGDDMSQSQISRGLAANHMGPSESHVEMLEPRLLMDSTSLLSSMVASGQAVATTWQGHSTYMVPGHWIVSASGVTDGANMLRARMLASDAQDANDPGTPDVVIGEALGSDGLFRLEAPPSATYEQVLQAVDGMPGFEYVEPDFLVWSDSIPNDPQFSSLYGLNNTGQSSGTIDADIDAPEAWNIDAGHGNVVVGVIDTGADYNHTDLAANIWTNSGEIPGNGIDDDSNGFIDDVHGYNFVGANSSDPMDDNFHGTHTAGTIGAVGNNGVGVAGVDWNVQIMPLKFLDSTGTGTTSDAIEAINYATMMRSRGVNIRVLSNSWGGGEYSSALEAAINQSAAAGILFVVAAGNKGANNDNTPSYPASYNCPNIIAVAATDRNDAMASFSSYGLSSVDIAAPGVDICSTLPGNSYGLLSGTSMATPMVAGVAALAFDMSPGATYQQVRDAILNGADRIASQAGKTVTGGRLNAYNTLMLMDMCVSSSQPAQGETIVAPPVDFTVSFSGAFDPTSVGAADLHVNGLPADSVTVRDSDTLVFHFNSSPVTVQGSQTMSMSAGAIRRALDLADLRAWNADFRYDQTVLGVTSTSPASLSMVSLPLSTIRVVFNEPFDPGTLDASDLMLSRGTVTGVTIVNSTTADFAVSGIMAEGMVNMAIASDSVSDMFGSPMAAFIGSFETDLVNMPFPTPLAQINPAGSMVYQGIANGTIGAGDSDSFTIQLDAGQVLSLALDVTAGLQPILTLRAPDGSVVANTTSGAAGLDAVIETAQVASAGTYVVDVSGVGISDGAYCLTVTLNAAMETEAHDGAANDTLAAAQNLTGAFVPLSGGSLATVLGTAGGNDDLYRLDLLAGESATAMTNVLTPAGNASLDLLDANGVLLASGQIGISNAYQAITDFRAQAAGAYYLRVRGSGDYSLVATKDAIFSLEFSGSSNAQMLGPGQQAIGAIHRGGSNSSAIKIGLIQDRYAWYTTSDLTIAAALGYTVVTIPSSSLATVDLSQFNFVVVAGAQSATFYQTLQNNMARIEAYVGSGGTLVATESAWSSDSPYSYDMLPGAAGVSFSYAGIRDINVLDPSSGLITGPGGIITDASLDDNGVDNSAYGYTTSTLPTGATAILSSGIASQVVAFEYPYGSGHVIAHTIPVGNVLNDSGNSSFDQFHKNLFSYAASLTTDYVISVVAGDHLVISTATPGDGGGQFVNALDPRIELYDPAGNEVAFDDNGGTDGRNALLEWTAASAGLYKVMVSSASGEGEYVLQVAGATGAATDTFAVASSTPADGAALGTAVTQCTVTFSEGLLLGTVSVGDLLVDGLPAPAVNVSSGNVLVFTLTPLASGHHTLSLAAGALTDLQGTALPAWSASFDLDLTPPRVMASSIVENDVVTPGDLTYSVTFSKQMDATWLYYGDIELSGATSGQHIPATYVYDPTGRILTATFTSLPDDNYTLTLVDFQDAGGMDLDGEPKWPLPSGNGTSGGNFVVHYQADITSTEFPAILVSTAPDSPIFQGTTPVATINTATDVDDYVLSVDPGQTLALIIHPTDSVLQPIVDLYAPGQTTPIATATAAGVGLDAILQATPVTGGAYTIRVHSAGASTGAYTVQAVLNAAIENEEHSGPANDLSSVAQDLDSSFISLGGSASRGAVLGSLPNVPNTESDWFSFTLNAGQAATVVATSPFYYQLGLDLYDSTGSLLLASAVASDTATIRDFVAPADGVYYARTTGMCGYSLVVTKGASGSQPAFTVTSSSLANNELLFASPSQIVFTLSSPVSIVSLSAGDLLIDGVAATNVTVTNGTTLTFGLPALADGHHTLSVVASAFTNLQGQGVAAFNGAFDLDSENARVVDSSIVENAIVPTGNLTYTVTFSRPMMVADLSSNDMFLVDATSVIHNPATMAYDPTGRILTLTYDALQENSYTLTLFSAYYAWGVWTGFQASTGASLDGEPNWPLPSGDGIAGGDFVLHFQTTNAFAGAIPLASISPSGSLIYQGTVLAGSIGSTDVDDYMLSVDPGQTLALAIHPNDSMLQPIVDLYAPGGTSPIATATAGGVGLDAVLQAEAVIGGTYTIRVHSAGGSTGAYTVQTVLNAAIESELHNGPANNLATVAQNLDPSFISLGGLASRGAVLGGLPTTENTTSDWYSFTLNAGQAASIVATSISRYLGLDLYDSTGTVLLSSMGASSVAPAIRNFVASANGVYYARVTGRGNYSLVVSRGAVLDSGSNTSTTTAQDISPASSALGYTSGSDYYAFYVNTGDILTLATTTPADGSNQFLNRLDPVLYLYNPSGTQLATNDNGAIDGRNALLTYTAATAGRYLVRVGNVGSYSGEYVLSVTGASGSLPAFTVTASTPANSAHLAAVPTQMVLTLSSAVLMGSVNAGDLFIDGLASATNVTITNGTTLTFDLPTLDVGHHTFSVLANAFWDLQNQAVTAFSGAFDVDTTIPRVVGCSVAEGDTLSVASSTTITITFSKPIKTANIGSDDFSCNGAFLGSRTPSFSFDPSGQVLTMTWSSMPEDNYTLTLLSGNNRFEDTAGVDLDGEANWPMPSGDGLAGGNFVVHFSVDSVTASVTSMTSRATPGGLVYDTYVYPVVNSPTDVDTYTMTLAPGQTVTVVAHPGTTLVPMIELYAPGASTPMAWAVASAAGKDALIQVAPISVGGTYTVRSHGASGTVGSVSCRFILDALVEAEANSGPTNDQLTDAQDLDPSMIAVGGNVWRGALIGALPGTANSTSDWYRLSLSAGETTTLAAATLSPNASLTISLYDAAGILLCTTGPGITTPAIRDFVAQSSGTYFVQMTGIRSYSLVVTRGAALDNGANSSISLAQTLGLTTAVLGNTSGSDYYALDARAGDVLALTTATPGNGPGLPANLLDPVLYIRDASGTVLASDDDSAADHRNASLVYTAPATGRYYVQVGAAASAGDYMLNATGTSDELLAFEVTAMTPASGSALEASPASITLTLGDQVLGSSLQPSDLRVNGQSATAVTLVSDKTVRFDLPALADGSYSVMVAAGAFVDLQGTPVSAYSGSFSLDTAAPRVVASTLGELDAVPTGALVYKVTFSKTMAISGITASDLTCIGDRSGARTPTLVWDGTSKVLTLTFTSLAEDNYTLTLLSGNGRFEDVYGLDLDGEAKWPLPSGDGTSGGNFVLHFRTDAGMVHVTPPTGVPDLAAASDHGNSYSDNLTNLNNASAAAALTFSVSGTVVGALVTLYADGVAIGSTTAVSTYTQISTNGSRVLSDGTHMFTATQVQSGYLPSSATGSLAVSIDATVPIATAPDLVSGSDTGVSSSDNVTRGVTPQFSGSVSDPLVGGFSSGIYEVAVDPDIGTGVSIYGSIQGSYLANLPTLAEGSRTVYATVYDNAGNSATATLSVMVDRTAPRVSTFGISSTLSSWAMGTVDSSVWTTGRTGQTASWNAINRFVVDFNEAVQTTPSALGLTGQNTAGIGLTQQGSGIASRLSWASANGLASDRYDIRLPACTVTDLAGNAMAEDWQFALNILVGDSSGDGKVDFDDYLILEANFGTIGDGTIHAGDFTGEGNVDFDDYLVLEANFGSFNAAAAVEQQSNLAAQQTLALQATPQMVALQEPLAVDPSAMVAPAVNTVTVRPVIEAIAQRALVAVPLSREAAQWPGIIASQSCASGHARYRRPVDSDPTLTDPLGRWMSLWHGLP